MSALARYVLPMTILAAVGSGAMAGLLFAFSNFVMKALTKLPHEQGMAAMPFINVAIINPVFLFLLLGTAVLCVLLVVHSIFRWHGASSLWLLVGSGCYLLGMLGITLAFNVPLNNALAETQASAVAAEAWPSYVNSWLGWNHVRTAMSFVAAASFTLAASFLRGLGA